MDKIRNIRIDQYHYNLPHDRIAKFPLAQRDSSQLLVCKNMLIKDASFADLPGFIPERSLIVFNDTRVIQARLLFHKPTGAKIEIFCLEPYDTSDMQLAFHHKGRSTWKCFIGNARRWKSGGISIENDRIKLCANLLEKQDNAFIVEFSWKPADLTFAEIMDICGLIPLPPYLDREPVEDDKSNYQTIYADHDGSVAAPTAGLHFTDEVLEKLRNQNVAIGKLTLHVGAGTFKPVVSKTIDQHEMHFEKISVSRKNIQNLLKYIDKSIIAVGTTSVRTLESLYWFSIKLQTEQKDYDQLEVEQWDPYREKYQIKISPAEALENLLLWMENKKLNDLSGSTQLMIVPGYQFKIVKGMLTNFHLPKSTLLLLVAAFIGENWKKVYQHALNNDYRFLSYGDGCLFLRE